MKHVLEYLSRHKELNPWGYTLVKVLIIIGALAMVSKVLYDGFTAFQNSAFAHTAAKTKEQKENCLGEYNTIPCHQYKIEQLLLESRRPKQ